MPRALRNVFPLRRAGVFSFQASTPFQGWLGEAWTNNMHVTSNVIFRKHTFNPRLLDHADNCRRETESNRAGQHFVTWEHFSVILQGELGLLTRPTFIFLSDFLSLSFLFLLSPLGICVSGVESSIITVACVAGVWKGGKRRFWARGKREGRASVWGKEKGVLKNSLSVPFQTPATQVIITAVEPLALFSVEAFYFSMIANFIAIPSGKLCGGEKISTTTTLETEEGTQPRILPKCIDNTF